MAFVHHLGAKYPSLRSPHSSSFCCGDYFCFGLLVAFRCNLTFVTFEEDRLGVGVVLVWFGLVVIFKTGFHYLA